MNLMLAGAMICIDPALNAIVVPVPDGYQIVARSSLMGSTAAEPESTAAVTQAEPETEVEIAVAAPKDKAKSNKTRRPANHIAKVRSGMGPFEICRQTGVLPPSLKLCIQGRNYYQEFGGSEALWAEHYAQHKTEWDLIAAHGDRLPPAAA